MIRPRHAAAALALATVLAAALLPRAAAASKADAFEGKIQPVSGQLFRKAGRLELTVGGGLSLNDAFFQKRFGDVKLGYHFTNSLSASVHYGTGAAVATSSTTVCPTGEACRPASEEQLRQVPGRIRSIVGAEFAWAPIYGKLNTFSEQVAHIDLSIMVGVDMVTHDEVLTAAGAVSAPGTKTGVLPLPFTSTELPVSAHVGVGFRLFLKEFLAVRLDLKDYVYGVAVPLPAGPGGTDMQNQLFAELGVSVFFPFSNRRLP